MQLSSRKPATMSRTSLITSVHTLTTRTLPFRSTRTPLSQTLLFSRSRLTLRAKILGAWCYSLFAPCFVVLLFLVHQQSHYCSAHIHKVVAKKRDASTELLQFLNSKMLEHKVDFIGGDFNMSAFSTVSDVFSDPEFSAPGQFVSVGTRCFGRTTSGMYWLSHHAQATIRMACGLAWLL